MPIKLMVKLMGEKVEREFIKKLINTRVGKTFTFAIITIVTEHLSK